MNDQEWKNRLISYIVALESEYLTADIEHKIEIEIQNIKNEELLKIQQIKEMEESTKHKNTMSKAEIINLFHSIFYGRQDVFAVRWENDKGESGYTPKCKNEWVRGVCYKGKVKGACRKCTFKEYQCLTDEFIEKHFTTTGKNAIVLGIYPLLEDDTCRFLAIDFDEADWKEDIINVKSICKEYGIETYIERSRSGNGGHLWIFFSEKIEAYTARKLGIKILETSISRYGKGKFKSFDRMFPNQDRMPQGGFGNLIALPLQKISVEMGNGVFVDDDFGMIPSQIELLSSINRYSRRDINECLQKFPDIVLDDISDIEITEEENNIPWVKKKEEKIPSDIGKSIEIVLYDRLYIEKSSLHPFLKKKIVALTVFRNPEYYLAKRLRKNLSDIPSWIQCYEENADFFIMPIGCKEALEEICSTYGMMVTVLDKRFIGQKIAVEFYGDLRSKQVEAVENLLSAEHGILHANTAFGKTVAAIALLAERKVNTLIIVDRVQLMEQWRERLSVFLKMPKNEIGTIGGGKSKPLGKIDIAICQSLYRNGEASELIKGYGQVIVDECHHVSAVGFEEILKKSPAKYKYGLTATLKRKDGKERIVLMQLGPVRYKDLSKVSSSLLHQVLVQKTSAGIFEFKSEISTNELYDNLYKNDLRNLQIVMDIRNSINAGKYPIVITERKEHVTMLGEMLKDYMRVFVLTGGIKKKELIEIMDTLNKLDDNVKRVIIATSKFIGEGFDYPILDTLFITLPISWSGRIKQYAGRLHREYHEKKEVIIYDYVDSEIKLADKMFERRIKSYKSMGYEIINNM